MTCNLNRSRSALLPRRLAKQLQRLKESGGTVLVAVGTLPTAASMVPPLPLIQVRSTQIERRPGGRHGVLAGEWNEGWGGSLPLRALPAKGTRQDTVPPVRP